MWSKYFFRVSYMCHNQWHPDAINSMANDVTWAFKLLNALKLCIFPWWEKRHEILHSFELKCYHTDNSGILFFTAQFQTHGFSGTFFFFFPSLAVADLHSVNH